MHAIRTELERYDPGLASKPEIVVVTKLDAVQDREPVERIREAAATTGSDVLEISAVTGDGLTALVRVIGEALDLGRLPDPLRTFEGDPGGTTIGSPGVHGHVIRTFWK